MEKLIQDMKEHGKVFIVGEFRGHRTETINYVSKKSGQVSAFSHLVFLVERSGKADSVSISKPIKESEVDSVNVVIKKGQICAFEISTLKNERGFITAKMPATAEPLPI